MTAPTNAQFHEGWASGSIGLLGPHANNCPMVTVADGGLTVTPRFILKWLVPWLNFRVPLSAINGAEPRATFFGGKYIDVSFNDPKNGRARTVSLTLKQPDAFLAALGK